MRRALAAQRFVLVVSIAALFLAAPAPATADVLEVFQELAARNLRPAPLVPTTVPRSLEPLDQTIALGTTRRRSAYAIRPFRLGANAAVILLNGGDFPTAGAALRNFRKSGYRARSTRVRGRRGFLLSRGLRVGTARILLWVEDRRVYWIGSASPKTVSLSELRATAEGLDQLGGYFTGSDANGEQEAIVATTRRTITAVVTWTAQCTAPDGSSASPRAGQAFVTLLPRRGAEFSFDLAANLGGSNPAPWQGTASGTVGTSGGTVNLRATTTVDGDSCDTGPLSFAVRPPA